VSSWYERLVSNHPLANITFLLVLFGGLYTYLTLPRAQDPEINFNWVSIVTVLPGGSAEDIEREITSPLEDAIAQVKDIKFVSSSSREGLSSILVRFEELSDRVFDKRINDLRREIQNKASAELPADATDPVVMEITTSNGFPTANLVVYGSGGEALRSAAAMLKKDIEQFVGVDQVLAVGLDDPELHVDFDPARVAAAGLSPAQVADGVAQWFRNVLAGRVTTQGSEWLVRLEGKTADPAVLAQAAVITPQGRVALAEIAAVSLGHERTSELVSFTGHPAVLLSVTKQADANTIELVERLTRYAEQRNPLLLGQGVQLVVADDQTHATRRAISLMESNALLGLFAVLGMCWLFLGTRLAILVSLGIPFSLAGAFLCVYLIDSTLNLTVLLGIVIALGMVVDDAVVIVEAVYFRMSRGDAPMTAVVEGVREVAAPVLAAILTTVAAFLPLMLLPGILGKFMFLVPFVVTAALLISLLEAFWILPTHVLAIRLDFTHRPSRMQRARETFTHWLRVKYARMLISVMRHPRIGLGVVVLTMAGAVGLVTEGVVKRDFFAFDSVRQFFVHVDMPPGVTLARSLEQAERAAAVVSATVGEDELRSVTAVAGVKFTDTEPLYGPQYAQVIVALKPRINGMRDTGEVIEALREPIQALEGVGRFNFLEMKGGPPTSKPINVKLKSDDYTELRAAADALLAQVRAIPGVHDISDDDVAGRSELRLVMNREKLARAGIGPGEVARMLRLYGEGEMVGATRDRGEKVEVIVRARPEPFSDVVELLQRPVRSPGGELIELGNLVDAETRITKGYIRHYQLKRAITVEAELDRKLTDTVKANEQLKAGWASLQQAYPNVSLDFSGELDDIQESLDSMAMLFALGVGLIYLILAAQFKSYFQPIIVLVTVPLAFTGVVLGLLVSGNPLSLYTLYGVVALAGIAVNAAIVLIAAANERLAAGMSVQHAAIYAARRRVVPIIITTVTTIGGLFSLAIGLGGKSLMWGPVAASIVWGLGFSAILTLFAIPLVWRLAMGRRSKAGAAPIALAEAASDSSYG
jgi:multidrug efflux pump subunit AcrB